MYISLFPASLLLSVAAAATTISGSSASSTACAAQPVMDSCYASTSAIAQACTTTDYGCLCSKWNDVLTCFLQCPNDPRYASAKSSHETYCNDFVAYGGTTTSAISRAVSAVSTITSGSSGAQATESSGAVRVASSTTASGAGASSTTTVKNGAEGVAVGAGSVLMGVAGFVGAFL
ncbi:uncharacterized protein K444DRAFT_632096 [Hyaloscypha bicolor E]|uniref:Extracellular membrane protein CFEM domain-containing protein n=1 Tax=Hyaloscypha bicolor E TaxID=1095630 RepID=A0A2J6T1N1_9HELO|nr:uncharacterized protein K444DRAFT_632096 [Hyaloscypha bicolor E]PMD56938.1 hypothetical protein K444DRAFT_632096 [Hyaloscypha bicolor E]